jgi:hypothetical protein
MKLTTRELKLFITFLQVKEMYRYIDPTLWQPWMEDTLQKLTDELAPHE